MTRLFLFVYCSTLFHCARAQETQPKRTTVIDTALYAVADSLWVPLRDGTKVAGVLVYNKQQKLPLPAILSINCYPHNNPGEKRRALPMADSGYAVVIVYPRGKAASEGVFLPFENEVNDNYDIIDWISRQPWNNGNIGMYGGSYLGFTQWAAMKKPHPALKTIVPQVAVAPGIDFPNPNGIFFTYALQWLKYVRNGRFTDSREIADADKWRRIKNLYQFHGLPFNKFDSLEEHGTDEVFQKWLLHPATDSFWQQMTPAPADFAKISIPVLTMTGYFDADQQGALYYYNMHNKYGHEKAVSNHHLFIGPFDHNGAQGGTIRKKIQSYEIDSAAMISQFNLLMQWFNYTLRNGKKPAMLKDRVTLFSLGDNRWHSFASLAAMNKDTLVYHLSAKGKSNILTTENPAKQAALQLAFNPGALERDTGRVAPRPDSLPPVTANDPYAIIFESETLKEAITLNGSIVSDLYISSSSPDADIKINWWEVDSAGKWWPLSSLVQRLSHSFDRSYRQVLRPGKIYHLQLDQSRWMNKKIGRGSRIVMAIAPLLEQAFQRNYGGSKDVGMQRAQQAVPVKLSVYAGGRYPGRISLPLMRTAG